MAESNENGQEGEGMLLKNLYFCSVNILTVKEINAKKSKFVLISLIV